MERLWLLLVICLLPLANAWTDKSVRHFREEFLFGAATAAYQAEGGWDADGKGLSVWDKYLHENPSVVVDRSNGDVACDSYNLWQRDVEILRELGVDHYRFSISWPRVLPTGMPNNQNELGLQYYDNLINELLKYNIQPMITLYHFDLPQALQDLGGWANPLSADWFEDYARVIFDRYSDRVKYWITLNQPNFCMITYGAFEGVSFPPALDSKGIGDYMCVKNVIMAHARVYRLYERVYKRRYNGMVGISLSLNWMEGLDNSTESMEAAEENRQFYFGIFLNPIWGEHGDFPRLVKNIVAKRSKEQGYPSSRLPEFTAEEIQLVKGSADFLGMNHYTTFQVTRGEGTLNDDEDSNVAMSQSEHWSPAVSVWLKSAPYGLYKLCLYINKNYNYPPVIITENGWSTHAGLDDDSRAEYYKGYLNALLLAIEDGTDVRGFTAWSLMDNLEWISGFSERFGLYEVDFDSPERTRTPRTAAFFYKEVIEKRYVPNDWKPTRDAEMQISNRLKKKIKA